MVIDRPHEDPRRRPRAVSRRLVPPASSASVTSSTIISNSSALFTFVLNVLFKTESFTLCKALGVVSALVGAVAVRGGGHLLLWARDEKRNQLGTLIRPRVMGRGFLWREKAFRGRGSGYPPGHRGTSS